jgi:hypothetical protein
MMASVLEQGTDGHLKRFGDSDECRGAGIVAGAFDPSDGFTVQTGPFRNIPQAQTLLDSYPLDRPHELSVNTYVTGVNPWARTHCGAELVACLAG